MCKISTVKYCNIKYKYIANPDNNNLCVMTRIMWQNNLLNFRIHTNISQKYLVTILIVIAIPYYLVHFLWLLFVSKYL